MSIGARFRQLRLHLKLSGEQIGEICGVTKSMVSQWESDDTTPPVDRMITLAALHEFSLDWLFLNKGTMLPATDDGSITPAGMYVTDRKIMAATMVMEQLPEYGKDQAVKSITEIAELINHAKHNGTGG